MKKQLILTLCSALIIFGACNKDSKTPATPVTTTSPYYFKFKLDGVDYNLNYDFPQYISSSSNEIGGFQVGSFDLSPSVGISLSWPFGDTVKESDVMGLAGKTFYYNDTTIHPELTFSKDLSSDTWYSVDTANTSYYVKITDVAFLKNDTSIFSPVRVYTVKGTCTGVMSDYSKTVLLTGGEFNFRISRRDE